MGNGATYDSGQKVFVQSMLNGFIPANSIARKAIGIIKKSNLSNQEKEKCISEIIRSCITFIGVSKRQYDHSNSRAGKMSAGSTSVIVAGVVTFRAYPPPRKTVYSLSAGCKFRMMVPVETDYQRKNWFNTTDKSTVKGKLMLYPSPIDPRPIANQMREKVEDRVEKMRVNLQKAKDATKTDDFMKDIANQLFDQYDKNPAKYIPNRGYALALIRHGILASYTAQFLGDYFGNLSKGGDGDLKNMRSQINKLEESDKPISVEGIVTNNLENTLKILGYKPSFAPSIGVTDEHAKNAVRLSTSFLYAKTAEWFDMVKGQGCGTVQKKSSIGGKMEGRIQLNIK